MADKRGQHPNSQANLKKFSSENQPAKNGRRPSKLKHFINDNGLSAADVSAAIKYMFDLDEKEISDLAGDKSQPLLMRSFAAAMVSDIKNGKLDNIMTMMSRSMGTPKQTQEISLAANVSIDTEFELVDPDEVPQDLDADTEKA